MYVISLNHEKHQAEVYLKCSLGSIYRGKRKALNYPLHLCTFYS